MTARYFDRSILTSSCLCIFDLKHHLHKDCRLELLIDQNHGSFICMSPEEEIISNREQNHRAVQKGAPIHGRWLWVWRQREEREGVDQQQKRHRNDVGRQARSS